MGYSPWGCKESDMTEDTHTDTHKDYTIMDFTEWVNFLTDLTSFKVEWTQCHERGLNCNHYKNKCFLNMISPADCFQLFLAQHECQIKKNLRENLYE